MTTPGTATAPAATVAMTAAWGVLVGAVVLTGGGAAGSARQSSPPLPQLAATVAVNPELVVRAETEVATAVTEAGQPPCGKVAVFVQPTADGRSWAWPRQCRILLDAALVAAADDGFRYVVRHEVAHLHAGTDHFDPRFRALEARLAANVGYDLSYAPGAEYPRLVRRLHENGRRPRG